MNSKPVIKIGIVAGEKSGDRLGAKIISELKKFNDVELYGVGGPKLENEGLNSIFNFEKLHVMGLIEPLVKINELLGYRKKLIKLFCSNNIDYFIGIDSPDFNISIHKALKIKNLSKNIQVVSPSVWVWRENRVKAIKKYIDLTMCLFNFEDNYYKRNNLPSIHMGHPFKNLFPHKSENVYKRFDLNPDRKYIAVLPGSRKSELQNLLPTFVEFIKLHSKNNINYQYLIPASDQKSLEFIKSVTPKDLPIHIHLNCAREFLSIAEFSVVTSGTATLESAVLGTSPIICYKTNPLNYFIISRMLKTDDVGLPNLLLGSRHFPELIQKKCTAQTILDASKSINTNINIELISKELRNLLIGVSEEECTKAILQL